MYPVITTIIPVYNKERYLARCLESVTLQSIKELEIILINDGSTDSSLEVCREWEQRDQRIRVINKENEGAGTTRNRGIKESKGKYISFVDADDYIATDTYEICIKEMEETCADACYFGRNLESNGKLLDHAVRIKESHVYQGEEIKKEFINFFLGKLPEEEKQRFFVTGSACCTLFSGDFIRNNHICFPRAELKYSEDQLFNLELCRYAKKIAVIPNMLYYNCIQQDSASRGYAPDRFEVYKLLYSEMKKYTPLSIDMESAKRRVDFQFVLYICKCIRDEARYMKQNGIKVTYKNIKRISEDDTTQGCITQIEKKGFSSKRKLLLQFIKRKWIIAILAYYFIKGKIK